MDFPLSLFVRSDTNPDLSTHAVIVKIKLKNISLLAVKKAG
jgi:hypothetical protein